jgi:hypothetical protein
MPKELALYRLARHDLRRTCAHLCHEAGGELEQIQFLLVHASVQTTKRYIGFRQDLRQEVNDRLRSRSGATQSARAKSAHDSPVYHVVNESGPIAYGSGQSGALSTCPRAIICSAFRAIGQLCPEIEHTIRTQGAVKLRFNRGLREVLLVGRLSDYRSSRRLGDPGQRPTSLYLLCVRFDRPQESRRWSSSA